MDPVAGGRLFDLRFTEAGPELACTLPTSVPLAGPADRLILAV